MTELKQQFVKELKEYCGERGISVCKRSGERSDGVWEADNDPKIVIYVLTYGGTVRPGWQLRKVSALSESGLDLFVVLLKTGSGFMLHSQQAIQISQESRDCKVDENKIKKEAFTFTSYTVLFEKIFK